MIRLDVALNLLWLAISVAALLYFARLESKRTSKGHYHRLLAVCLMAVAIFPSISDSDDLFHFSLLQIPNSQTGGFGNTPQDERQERSNLQLARMLETLEHFQVSAVSVFFLALSCVAVALSLRVCYTTRTAGAYAGRAPPLD